MFAGFIRTDQECLEINNLNCLVKYQIIIIMVCIVLWFHSPHCCLSKMTKVGIFWPPDSILDDAEACKIESTCPDSILMLRHHLRSNLWHLDSILDGDHTIQIRFYMVRQTYNIESGFDIRCRSYHLDSIIPSNIESELGLLSDSILHGCNNHLISNLYQSYACKIKLK